MDGTWGGPSMAGTGIVWAKDHQTTRCDYPLHSYGKSQFLMGNLTINGHFQ